MPPYVRFLNAGALFGHAKDGYQRVASDSKEGQPHALTAVIFAAAALECFMNEISDLAIVPMGPWPSEPIFEAFNGLMEELEKSSVESKFCAVKWLFSGSPYDKGAAPFQDFKILVGLRNALIHLREDKFDPLDASKKSLDAPKVLRDLGSKGLLADFGGGVHASWVSQIETAAVARWACNSVTAMVHSILDTLPPSPQGDFFRRYYGKLFIPI